MENEGDKYRPLFVSEKYNLADLVAHMPQDDQKLYQSFGYVFTEAAFYNRRFVVVKLAGKSTSGKPKPPVVLGAARVVGFSATHLAGCKMTLQDEESERLLQVGHTPTRLFNFPVFVSVPIYQGVKWEAKEMSDGSYRRALVFGTCFKQQSALKWFNRDNVAVLTHNDFEETFGRP